MSILNRRQFLTASAVWGFGSMGNTLRADGISSITERAKGGHLTLGTRHDARGLDSHRFSQGRTASPIAAIYSGLTGIDRTGEVVPSLAEWYEPSSNLMSWSFRLRRGMLFHNGREVDAHSVKQNLLRLKAVAVDTTWRGGLDHVKSIEILDKYTVRLNLSVPDAALPAGVMHGLQAPETFRQSKDHPVGSGPFKLVSWKRYHETRLARFENYWETDVGGIALPYLKTVTALYKPEQESRYAALRSGAVDMVDDLSPSQVTSLHQADARRFQLWRVHVGGLLLAFNCRRGLFRDPRLRLAASLAIDRKTLHQAVFSGRGEILNQPYPLGSPWHVPHLQGVTYDPDQATALLKQARAVGTEIVMITGLSDSDRRQCTELIQQMWHEVGFQVRVDPLFGLQQEARRQAGTFDAQVGRHVYASDPDYVYRRYFHSQSPDAQQLSGWYSARLDALVEAGKTSRDRSRRHALYTEAIHLINRELPLLYLHEVTATVAAVTSFEGFAPGKVSTLTYQGGGLRTGHLET